MLLLTLEADGQHGVADTARVRRIRQLVEELGLGNHVQWLGILSPAEIRYLLQKATVAVFPSLEESFGLPLAEAITAGCPLAASDLPYARDVADRAAVYFDPLDPGSIAMCVTNLIEAPEQLTRLKQEARRLQARFHPRAVAEQIATILEAAAGRQKGSYAPFDPRVC
jgi:glycosyltransferase involved in cell wall biosynthesis